MKKKEYNVEILVHVSTLIKSKQTRDSGSNFIFEWDETLKLFLSILSLVILEEPEIELGTIAVSPKISPITSTILRSSHGSRTLLITD